MNKNKFFLKKIGVFLGVLLNFSFVEASPIQHGYAVFGRLKYSKDFKHFDYVNPNAFQGGIISLGALGDFDSLNPFIVKGIVPPKIECCYATLLAPSYDEVASYYTYVAQSIEIDPAGKWIAFHLNPSACFHNGQRVTADDVIFSFESLYRKGKPLFHSAYQVISKVEKVSDRQVKFYFKDKKAREIIGILGQIPVLSQKFYQNHEFCETNLETFPASGPYYVQSAQPGHSITYKKVKDWWGTHLPTQVGHYNFEEITIKFFRDPQVLFETFKKGEIDIRMDLSTKNWATEYNFQAVKDGKVKKIPLYGHKLSYGSYGLFFNTRKKIFGSREVRMAFIELFNFAWANKYLFYGLNKRNESYFPNSPFAAQGKPEGKELELLEPLKDKLPFELLTKKFVFPTHKTNEDLKQSRVKALSLLKKAGWALKGQKLVHEKTGKPFVFEILVKTAAGQKIGLHFQNCLKDVGITVKIVLTDHSIFQQRVDQRDFDMVLYNHIQSPTLGNEQRDMWSSEAADQNGSGNLAGVKDPTIDFLIEKLIESPDYETLTIRAQALDRLLLWGGYMIPAWQMEFIPWVVWDRFGFPEPMCPPYLPTSIHTWWIDPVKDKALN